MFLQLLLVSVLAITLGQPTHLNDEIIEREWQFFKANYNKIYESPTEENLRRNNFISTLLRVTKRNSENGLVKYGINKMSDWSEQEFQKLSSFHFDTRNMTFTKYEEIANLLPKPYGERMGLKQSNSFDWRNHGAVNPKVKQQGTCACCWAFAASAVWESAWKIKHGDLYSLSDQQILDCTGGNNDCKGGWTHEVFNNFGQNRRMINKEECYQYLPEDGVKGRCRSNRNCNVASVSRGYSFRGESEIEKNLRDNGPVAVTVGLDDDGHWHGYKEGIFRGPCRTTNDHMVVAVGYTPDYWIIRNSWDESWGDRGYMHLAKGACGIGQYGAIAII